MAISFILANSGTINAVYNGKAYVVPKDHPNYGEIKKAVAEGRGDDLATLVDVPKAVEVFAATAPIGTGEQKVTVKDGVVYLGANPVHNAVSDRILALMREGFPFQPMALFLENLMGNPSFRSVQELYKFLDRQGLPITEDGCFLGYKVVRENYTDKHTGTVDNRVGAKIPAMPRNMVDDNWRNACSSGYHVGSLEYVRNFCSGGEHLMIVKVNPKDVVSVPEGEETKLRTTWYEVLSELDPSVLQTVPLTGALYTSSGNPATPSNEVSGMGGFAYDNDEDEYDDEEWEDDEEDDEEEEEEDDDKEDDEEEEVNLGLTETLVLNLAKTLPQPFTRPQLDILTKRVGEGSSAHNHQIDEAFWRLVDANKFVSDGETIQVV
jgi:hypothetical protein